MQDTLSDKAVTMSDDLRQALNQFLVMRKATETAMNPRIYSPKKDGNIWKHKILVVHFTFSFFFQTLFHPGLGKSNRETDADAIRRTCMTCSCQRVAVTCPNCKASLVRIEHHGPWCGLVEPPWSEVFITRSWKSWCHCWKRTGCSRICRRNSAWLQFVSIPYQMWNLWPTTCRRRAIIQKSTISTICTSARKTSKNWTMLSKTSTDVAALYGPALVECFSPPARWGSLDFIRITSCYFLLLSLSCELQISVGTVGPLTFGARGWGPAVPTSERMSE